MKHEERASAIAGGQLAGALGYATMFTIAGAAPLPGLAGFLWMLWRRRAATAATA